MQYFNEVVVRNKMCFIKHFDILIAFCFAFVSKTWITQQIPLYSVTVYILIRHSENVQFIPGIYTYTQMDIS